MFRQRGQRNILICNQDSYPCKRFSYPSGGSALGATLKGGPEPILDTVKTADHEVVNTFHRVTPKGNACICRVGRLPGGPLCEDTERAVARPAEPPQLVARELFQLGQLLL